MGPKAQSPERALILDSSAILAAMLAEPAAGQVLERLSAEFSVGIAAPLSSRLGKDARPRLNEFLREADAEFLPFGPAHIDAAVDAFLRYGKGRHPAGLNFGDCLTYAVAAVGGLPLLFTGNDFSKTDIEAA